jgi:GTPase-associated system helical domain
MSNIAAHMRITGLQVTNEDVDTRKTAIATLTESYGALKTVDEIVVKAAEIASAIGGQGIPSASLGEEVEAAIQPHASAFLHSERPLEVGICAANALLDLISSEPGTSGWMVADVFATATWSALGFQRPIADVKREALRVEVLQASHRRSIKAAELARTRQLVPDFGEIPVGEADQAKANAAFKKATSATIACLRRNSALDREELDFLWWAMLGHSKLLGRRLATLNEVVRLIATGIEGARYLRQLPCDVHRDIVLRTVEADSPIDLAGVMGAIGQDRQPLIKAFATDAVLAAPIVFPLLNALVMGSTEVDGATVPRKASEWGARALLEAGFAHMRSSGLANL